MPKIDRSTAERYERRSYPGRLRRRTAGCWKLRLSDSAGLTQFGAGEVELAPGAATGLYHWHEREDEFVYVLQGEVIMVEGETEQVLKAGDCAGFKAGAGVAHTFENRSDTVARLLEIGTRYSETERVHYPGYDLVFERSEQGVRFASREGIRYQAHEEPARIEAANPNRKPPSALDID